ncbi:MAG: hypothetical protein R3A10_14165 [Caldilineaceae bacterium]
MGRTRSLRLVEDNLPENRIIALVSSVDRDRRTGAGGDQPSRD